jgi:hypothetical protein
MKRLIAILLFVGACASSGAHVVETPQAASLLTVHNGRTEDETIYIVLDGYRGRRLGEAKGLSTTTFVLTDLDVPIAGDVRFLAARFDHGTHGMLSDPLVVQRGASYDWRLFPTTGEDVISAHYKTR